MDRPVRERLNLPDPSVHIEKVVPLLKIIWLWKGSQCTGNRAIGHHGIGVGIQDHYTVRTRRGTIQDGVSRARSVRNENVSAIIDPSLFTKMGVTKGTCNLAPTAASPWCFLYPLVVMKSEPNASPTSWGSMRRNPLLYRRDVVVSVQVAHTHTHERPWDCYTQLHEYYSSNVA